MRRKDAILIILIIVCALVLYTVNRLLPRRSLDERTADVTLAPDAVTYLDEPTASPVSGETEKSEAVPKSEALVTPEETAAPEPEGTPVPEVSEAPVAETAQEPQTVGPTGPSLPANAAGPAGPAPAAAAEVRGYVVIRVGGRQYGDPIPMDRDKIITIRQSEDKINRVHITADSVEMHSSTCENQDCVGEGVITLENYKTRILSTYIICLPNGVEVEMVPVEDEADGKDESL